MSNSPTDTSEKRLCPECSSEIFGRDDKKFCSDQCRNSHNNKLNRDANNYVREVNNALRKNRRILLKLNVRDKSRTSKDELLRNGFNFDLFTNIYRTKEGKEYRYCYEQGYLEISPGTYMLVTKKEWM